MLQVKESNGNGITKSLSSDTLNSIATEDDSNSSQKDDSSIRDSDSGVPPMPLRRIKEISEYDDLNENTDITKSKLKDPVAGAESSAELVGFKTNPESKIQMMENEDATRNDLPSLQKRGEVLAPKKKREEEATDEDENIDDKERDVGSDVGVKFEEKDKYSVRLDDALAKLDELEEEKDERDEEKRNEIKKDLELDSKAKYKVNNIEKMPVASNTGAKEEENEKDKGVLDLKAELDQLKMDDKEKLKKSDDDDKSISESDASSTVTSPKRVC